MVFDQKILIIRFSAIGDIILATSPLKTIRNAFPKAQITFLTSAHFAPLLEYHPDIDRLIPFGVNSSALDLWGFAKYIIKQNYSHIFDLHNSLRSNIITSRTNSPIHQLKKPRWNRFMLFRFHVNKFSTDFSTLKMYHEHLGDIWKIGEDIPKTYLKVSQNEKKYALETMNEKEFMSIVPGAAWHQKQWSAEKYVELINQIGKPVVILGSKKDKICFKIANKTPLAKNLAGKTSLRQALAILSNSYHVIGSDTGLTHAAEALDISVSMILGPTSQETGAAAHLSKSNIIESNLWCRPCSQNGKRPCYRKTQLCMESISVSDVIQTLPNG
ncbi:MAG: glycosyltransferase family 9 protein [Candidatus Marinimicrobia bacterium]|jgi:lipopolysaccharide heptosyltransferase II|nr:glycosyltransferase family 9 protein [Candidatus Neomarinimicrobiota bacterium]MBT3501445.1 glycosyltransferase family 9 protein [Candidatus Neomarinimicrobiota bacterium]MBT3839416.1 glycosyltransferase family 9 protein [Candidatus Neomarinimicrobiota bacterium]MBT3998599.1 glycosyltransferase family 9 protein [Candidatus Neomarinimicrobiota bacterium]MBT4283071.1 glycosyltransferase family 9 protein [Candidatus Neomarinimicrobiota bacterium]